MQLIDVTLKIPQPWFFKNLSPAGQLPKLLLLLLWGIRIIGRQFKQQLALIVASGSRAPIRVTYSVYLGTTDAPQVTWSLYVSDAAGVQFGAEAVQVTATDDNPMRRAAGLIYDPATFTGLELI